MPRKFTKPVDGDDDLVVFTNTPREVVQLRAEGFTEVHEEPPSRSASAADWRAYAVTQGYSEEDAQSVSKASLVKQYLEADDAGDGADGDEGAEQ